MIVRTEKDFKELEIILSDFKCDKNCPYCTAKITRWPIIDDDINMLSLYVGQLKELGYKFHYVTIGGNGEPTKHSFNKLKQIVELFDDYEGIGIKRVLTSGNVFRESEREKYNLFMEHNWMFEVTTTTIDNEVDRKVLGYNHNYFDTEVFKKARIRLNYVLLKDNVDKFVDEIKLFLLKYPNIETVALKLLNINTKTGRIDNSLSKWIKDNAIMKEERAMIADILNNNFVFQGEKFDTFSWKTELDKEIYFSYKSLEYGLYDLVYYGNKFINYNLESVSLTHLLPKVYIGSKFNKKIINDNEFTLEDDFRTTLIGKENNFRYFNNSSFIRDKNGELKYQYLGPFYNEMASSGELTSDICEEVVSTENRLIDRCDLFIVYLDNNVSPGSITELTYASLNNKKIIIFYKREDDVKYDLKSSNWYPIVSARIIAGDDNVKIIPVSSEEEIVHHIKNNEF